MSIFHKILTKLRSNLKGNSEGDSRILKCIFPNMDVLYKVQHLEKNFGVLGWYSGGEFNNLKDAENSVIEYNASLQAETLKRGTIVKYYKNKQNL